MYKILLGKFIASKDVSKFDKALEYLEEQKSCFGI